MGNRKWDEIYNNLDALTPEDREEIALKVKIVGEILKARKEKELAGHDDIGSTEIYAHVDMSDVRKAVEKHPLG